MAVILPSVYKDGTATVAAGGTAVTGQSTLWTQAVLPGDFFGVHKGRPIRIASVESNTALTLADQWPEAAQTAAAYAIMLQSDMARVQESTRQLLEKLLGGNLDAFAGLTGAADKVPYFTGAGTMAVADFKAKGRSIAASDTTANLLSKLGPVFGGPAPVPSSADVGLSDGDFNAIIVPGVYSISGDWTNGPLAGSASYTAILEVSARSFNNFYVQILRRSNGVSYKRYTTTASGASWPNAWEVFESPTVGTVSNGGGQPFGSIIERGSNANGEYVKFADGTMICWSPPVTTDSNVADGNVFRSVSTASSWTFPSAFTATPNVSGCISNTVSAWAAPRGASATSAWIVSWSSASRTGDTVRAMAIGRWF